jgi:hypothetical protein
MGVRDAFDGDEWTRVMAGPALAGMAITAADPGGLWGALKEGLALGGALRAGPEGGSALVDAVIADYQNSDARGPAMDAIKARVKGGDAKAVCAAAVAELGAVAKLVAAKAPADAAAYKAWLSTIAHKVAEAGVEGGFLGFGGEKVSDDERAALADIDSALA